MRYFLVFLVGFVIGKVELSGLLKIGDAISNKAGSQLQEMTKGDQK